MRVVKEAEERKNEILDVAARLFAQKGFDHTSTNDILDEVGIARGTLYYHFKSKQAIMDALIERFNDSILRRANRIAQEKELPVYQRIMQVVRALNISEENGQAVMEHLHNPQNALMHQKIQKVILAGVTPLLADLIREGIAQGLFATPYPYECMEMVVAYIQTVLDGDLVELTYEEQASRIAALLFNIERLLGVEDGSLRHMMQMFE